MQDSVQDPGSHPGQDPGLRLEVCGRLTWTDIASVAALTEAALEADGVRPLSERVSLRLRHGGPDLDRNILVLTPGPDGRDRVVGYAHLDPTDAVAGSSAELVVHPAFRRRGLGRLLVRTALAESPDGRLRLWAHGDRPAARRLAEDLGFRVVRRLEQLHRPLGPGLPEVPPPSGVRLRPFGPGRDEATWLELNARVFAAHPEQGSWTVDDLRMRMRESWFDPSGFLVAEQVGTGEGGADGPPRMVGFAWTKVHGDDRGADGRQHGHAPLGEVYVVGVDPQFRGHGLGRALTAAGLHWLRGRGLSAAVLYVEADNAPAQAVYRGLGFAPRDTDVVFSRP